LLADLFDLTQLLGGLTEISCSSKGGKNNVPFETQLFHLRFSTNDDKRIFLVHTTNKYRKIERNNDKVMAINTNDRKGTFR
jgi:hypothetical protein